MLNFNNETDSLRIVPQIGDGRSDIFFKTAGIIVRIKTAVWSMEFQQNTRLT